MPDITIHIPDNKWVEFSTHFLLTHPNQTLDTPTPLSDTNWIKRRVLLFARGAYEKGVRQVWDQQAQPPIDPDVISPKDQ